MKSVWNFMFHCNNRVSVFLRTLYKKKGQWAYGSQEKSTFCGFFRLPRDCFSPTRGTSAHLLWMPSPSRSGTPPPLVFPSASLATLLLPPQWAPLLSSDHFCCQDFLAPQPSSLLYTVPLSHVVQSLGKSNPRPHRQENPVQDQHFFLKISVYYYSELFLQPTLTLKIRVLPNNTACN